MSSAVAESAKIPRPVMKGRHEKHLAKGIALSLGAASISGALFAYYGIYKHHIWWMKYWGNFDHEARKERISVNEDVYFQKWEYWWRTGEWVGNGHVVPPALPLGTALGAHPRLIRKE